MKDRQSPQIVLKEDNFCRCPQSSVFLLCSLSTAIFALGELAGAQMPYQIHPSTKSVWEEKVSVPENYGLNA